MQKTILYAEDNENDVVLVRMAFKKVAPHLQLETVEDGVQAVEFLKGTGQFENRTLPSLVLLDLKMPRSNGFEVVQWVRSNPALRFLPVVMFTASLEKSDQERCYQLGANSFLVKPSDIEALIGLAGVLHKYWLEANQCPHPDSAAFISKAV